LGTSRRRGMLLLPILCQIQLNYFRSHGCLLREQPLTSAENISSSCGCTLTTHGQEANTYR